MSLGIGVTIWTYTNGTTWFVWIGGILGGLVTMCKGLEVCCIEKSEVKRPVSTTGTEDAASISVAVDDAGDGGYNLDDRRSVL